ncbi:hypothetical protein DPMN_088556 [Dreissena polymorpha]|uniref:Uncharacterized protein n=1 Tax=Dreissena polymorpha TaxID=45954 RepID=A0A9D4QXD9_DREPO|nr:hypothetical protein DPMN_088556 [Dreissena polymorpha]
MTSFSSMFGESCSSSALVSFSHSTVCLASVLNPSRSSSSSCRICFCSFKTSLILGIERSM